MSPRFQTRLGCVSANLFCALLLIGATGCRPPQGEDSADTATGASATAETGQPAAGAPADSDPTGSQDVDDRDDPQAPACLPKSGEVGRWAKYEPVRVVEGQAVGQLVTPEEAARFSHFAVTSAARCGYALPAADGTTGRIQVVVVTADSVDDAYGLMSCQSSSPHTAAVGGETRVEQLQGLHFHCWQGRSYIHLWTIQQAAESAEQTLKLFRYIAAQIPREDQPELLEALPSEGQVPGQRWLVRDLRSISATALGLHPAPDLTKVNGLLALGGETVMCIAAYDLPEARRPNIVWLIRYPSDQLANQAHQRYSDHLAKATQPAAVSTNLLSPHGPFLIGTWTAEEESLQYMMPRIKQLLPS